jgi:membrane protease YdiL (CAAX protease family)
VGNWSGARAVRVAELSLLYGVLPAAIASGIVPLRARWLVFLGTGLYVIAVLIRNRVGPARLGLPTVRNRLAGLLAIFVLGAGLAIGLLVWADAVPAVTGVRWTLVFVLYPAISVPAQEVFFRGFFFVRYEDLLPGALIVPVNALLFSLYHAIFGSGLAVAAAAVAGAILAAVYRSSRDLYRCWLLHYAFGIAAYLAGWVEGFTALPIFSLDGLR